VHVQLPLVKGWREMLTEVGEKQSLAGSLRQSAYYALFKDQIEGWEKRLAVLAESLTTMSQVQRKWVYLEPIFSRGALPEQAQRFRYGGGMLQILSCCLLQSIPGASDYSRLPGMGSVSSNAAACRLMAWCVRTRCIAGRR
jgi:hypothetical protein